MMNRTLVPNNSAPGYALESRVWWLEDPGSVDQSRTRETSKDEDNEHLSGSISTTASRSLNSSGASPNRTPKSERETFHPSVSRPVLDRCIELLLTSTTTAQWKAED